MANIIAVVWDFDKTLVNGYMEEPIFEYYGVDSSDFWREVNFLPEKYRVEQGVRVNPDTIYLNHFIHCAKKGIFKGLNNAMLYDFGKNLHFYEGIPEIFEETRKLIEEDSIYQEYDIKVEHYIVSTGLSQVIKGSVVAQYVQRQSLLLPGLILYLWKNRFLSIMEWILPTFGEKLIFFRKNIE